MSYSDQKKNKGINRAQQREAVNRRPLTDFITLERSPNGTRNQFVCPVCGSGTGKNRSGALTYYPESNRYLCFACPEKEGFGKPGQDTLGALRLLWGCSESEVFDRVNGAQPIPEKVKTPAPLQVSAPDREQERPTPTDFTPYYAQCRGRLSDSAAVSYLQARGISLDTAAKCGIGFDPAADPAQKGHPAPRLIIPTSTTHYVARSVDKQTPEKYAKLNPRGAHPGIFNSDTLWNISYRCVFVVEGVFDALSIIETGAAAVALNSTSNTDLLLQLLRKRRTAATLILCLDNDDAGKRATENLKKALLEMEIPFGIVDICAGHKDPNEALTADRGAFFAAVEQAERKAVSMSNYTITLDEIEALDESPMYKETAKAYLHSLNAVHQRTDRATAALQAAEKERSSTCELNELQASDYFLKTFPGSGDYLRYRIGGIKEEWIFYDGSRWTVTGAQKKAESMLKKFALLYRKKQQEELEEQGAEEKQRKACYSFYNRTIAGKTGQRHILELASSSLVIDAAQFDQKPELWNFSDFTVNARTGETHFHTAYDYLTTVLDYPFDPARNKPVLEFLQLIDDCVTTDENGKQRFLEELAAMTDPSTVAGRKKPILILYGESGNNFKSPLMTILTKLFGDRVGHLKQCDIKSTQYGSQGGANTQLAQALTKNFIMLNDTVTKSGEMIDAELLKSISGNDVTVCRKLYENELNEIPPNALLMIPTNCILQFSTTDDAMLGRLLVIPFDRYFEESPEIAERIERILQERGQIMRYLFNLNRLRREDKERRGKFMQSEDLQQRTDDYIEKMLAGVKQEQVTADTPAAWDSFVSDCLKITGDPGDRATRNALLNLYQEYCKSIAFVTPSSKRCLYKAVLKQDGVQVYRTKSDRGFSGMLLV